MGLKSILTSLLSLLILAFGFQAMAQESTIEDGFEPFADYSEFVEASTEETDVNFFRYGRLLSFGVSVGQQMLTGDQRQFVDDSLEFSAFVAFYMTINFAFQFGYKTSSHDIFFDVPEIDTSFTGTTRFENYFFHAKYTLNTQNLTKTIANFNPYIIGGISQMYRNSTTPSQRLVSARDGAASFDLGAGLEKLFNHNKNFVGVQLMYHYANFPNENNPIIINDNSESGLDIDTGLRFGGDVWSFNVNIGFNF